MRFGNWQVTGDEIKWEGAGLNRFLIPTDQLMATRARGEELFYEWILTATAQNWLTQNDLYDLNYAFVFAAAQKDLDFDYDIFDATLEEQFDQFDIEDADNFDL
jgi:hypothetical protein